MNWITDSIRSNKLKTFFLLTCFPIILFALCFILFLIIDKDSKTTLMDSAYVASLISIFITIIWIISLFFQKNIIFKYTWARAISRKENPRIYNIVENLCISKWIPTPKIWIIQDNSLNAFATWRSEKDSRIVFTTWLIERLETREIEAVAWHELTHILNRDCRLMAVITIYIGLISTIWSFLIRTTWSSNNNKNRNILPLIWFILLLLGYIFYPLIKLAISRNREYLADTWSVSITKDKDAMISALKKISSDSIVESIQKDTLAAMCIENPLRKTTSKLKNLLSTHPSIDDRIASLEKLY